MNIKQEINKLKKQALYIKEQYDDCSKVWSKTIKELKEEELSYDRR